MARSVWKFPIYPETMQDVDMPAGAHALSVEFQRGTLCLWALVDPHANMVKRRVVVLGTGHVAEIDDGLQFIGTVLMMEGDLVFHVFVEKAGE